MARLDFRKGYGASACSDLCLGLECFSWDAQNQNPDFSEDLRHGATAEVDMLKVLLETNAFIWGGAMAQIIT